MRLLIFLFIFCWQLMSWGFVAYECNKMIKYSVLGPTTASSMFFSSTGKCSALKDEDETSESRIFVQNNNEEIKEDIANGRGEHLDTLTGMMNCSSQRRPLYPRLQKEFISLLNGEGTLIYRQIQRVYSKVCK